MGISRHTDTTELSWNELKRHFDDPANSVGFTASRKFLEGNEYGLANWLESMRLTIRDLRASRFVTGGCVGGDAIIAKLLKELHPHVPHTVVVPGDTSQVDWAAVALASSVIHMPANTSYRQRNERIVALSNRVVAFWNGDTRSGTTMTVNIARRAGKFVESDLHIECPWARAGQEDK